MNPVAFIVGYLQWHYSVAFLDILRVWGNFMWFVVHFLSTWTLMKTFLSPWRKLHEEYKKGLEPGAFVATLIVNSLMRLLGIIIRALVILISLILLLLVFCIGAALLVFWIVAPAGIFYLFGLGFSLAF